MQIGWKPRMAAARREVWTGAQLQRLLAERAGLETLIALCTALECTPNDLFDIDTTPVAQPISSKPATVAVNDAPASRRGRSMPPI